MENRIITDKLGKLNGWTGSILKFGILSPSNSLEVNYCKPYNCVQLINSI